MIWRSVVLVVLVAVATASAGSSQSAGTCQACRSLVSFSRKLNSTNHRDDYKNLIEKFCEQYFEASTDYQTGPCPMLADGFFRLLDNIDPVYHCDDIGACSPTADLPSDDIYDFSVQAARPVMGKPDDPALCTFCESMVNQVKAILTNPKAVNKLRRDARAFCAYLAVIDEDKACLDVVTNYLDTAINFVNQIDATRYCRDVRMCPRGHRSVASANLPTLADFSNFGLETSVSIGTRAMTSGTKTGGECVLCRTIVKEMFMFLRDNKTEASIIQGLDQVCSLLYPGHSENYRQCVGLVKAYTRELVELLVDETDPDMVCTILGLCPNSGSTPRVGTPEIADLGDLISSLDPNIDAPTPRSCVECKMFINYIKSVLDEPSSEEELKDWLDANLCGEMPSGNLRETCKSMVDSYSDLFFKVLTGKLDPNAACVELHACKPRTPVQLFDMRSSFLGEYQKTKEQRCVRCAVIVKRFDEYLSAPPSYSSLLEACHSFREPVLKRECNIMAEMKGLDIIQMVPDMDNPRQLCLRLSLC